RPYKNPTTKERAWGKSGNSSRGRNQNTVFGKRGAFATLFFVEQGQRPLECLRHLKGEKTHYGPNTAGFCRRAQGKSVLESDSGIVSGADLFQLLFDRIRYFQGIDKL